MCDTCHALLCDDKEYSNDRCHTCTDNSNSLYEFRAAFDRVSPEHYLDCLHYVRTRVQGRYRSAAHIAMHCAGMVAFIVFLGGFVLPVTIKASVALFLYSWNLLP